MRHAKTIAILAAILAVSLAPMIALRFFSHEASALMLVPVSSAIESGTGISSETVAAVWIMTSFVIATLTASALMAVLAGALSRSARGIS